MRHRVRALLLRLAYGILKMYKEKPTNIELDRVILIQGCRFGVTDFTIDMGYDRCPSVTIHGVGMGGFYGRN